MPSAEELNAALHDPTASLNRRLVAGRVGQALADAGGILFTSGHIIGSDRQSGLSPFGHGNDREVGVATASQIGGELVLGAAKLIETDLLYAAMALVRQLVEVEYLLWAFGSQAAESDVWLRSSHDDRLRMWQPRHLRAKSNGRFGTQDYQNHCNRGGHPTPEARYLLPGHSVRLSQDAVWVELAQHGVGCWDHLVTAIAELDSLESLGPLLLEHPSVREFHASRHLWTSTEHFPTLAQAWTSDQQQNA
jgi:hypothetical protein